MSDDDTIRERIIAELSKQSWASCKRAQQILSGNDADDLASPQHGKSLDVIALHQTYDVFQLRIFGHGAYVARHDFLHKLPGCASVLTGKTTGAQKEFAPPSMIRAA